MTAVLKSFHESGLPSPFAVVKRSPDHRVVNILCPGDGYPQSVEGFAVRLPFTARKLHGCINCEWRPNGLCPHGFRKGRGFELAKNLHANKICDERINYLLSFSRGYDKRPSFSQWQRDFNIGLAQVQNMHDFVKLKAVESELSSLPDGSDIKAVRALESRRRVLRAEWHGLWRDITKFEESQIDREMPKKVEVDHTVLSISDIHNIIRGGFVDAEYSVKELKEEENDKNENDKEEDVYQE